MQPDDDNTQAVTVLATGTVVNHYRIIEKIGAGGMGEVYLAEDTNLNRRIAIKVLPDLFSSDHERLARFEREAKLLGSLNHPNLATIHGLESTSGKPLLIMEFVAGETLAQLIAKGPLPVEEALEVCRQIAEGMEAAHERGIIHRDLKPANIKITPEGKVKILDFGLAKAIHEEVLATDAAQSPTVTERMTRAGVILGTAAYMSPEQAKGKPVDKRTDIWAFGCILFECLTGKRAFEGETVSETLAAILRGEPGWNQLPTETPAYIRGLLQRCLEKDPHRRLRDIGDALPGGWDSADLSSGLHLVRRRFGQTYAPWAIVALLIVVVAYLLLADRRNRKVEAEPTVSYILPPDNSVECFNDGFALSPDGRKLAFVSLSSDGERQLWVRYLDRRDASSLAGTDEAGYPFWSPDSKHLAFYAGGYLKRIAIGSGSVQTLCRASLMGRWGGSWGRAGTILFNDVFEGISLISESGGESERVIPDGTMAFPSFLPDGQRFLHIGLDNGRTKLLMSSTTQPDSSREIRGAVDVGRAEWVAPNRVIIWRQSDRCLLSQLLDLESDTVQGTPRLLAENVPSPGDWPMFSVSATDVAAFVIFPPEFANIVSSRLDYVNRQGISRGPLGEIGCWNLRISPDGRRVAINYNDDVWIVDVETGLPTRLTHEMNSGGSAYRPIWSPRGDRVLARRGRGGISELMEYRVPVGQPRVIWMDSSSYWNATDWSRDERYIILSRNVGSGDMSDLVYLDASNSKLRPLLTTSFDEFEGVFSPDGRWIAYSSNESGAYEVYIRSFPDGGQKRRVSYSGGMHPRWRADGQELFFLGQGWTVMVAEAKLQPGLEIGTPKPLFQMVMADIMRGQIASFDVFPDGQHLLVITPERKPLPITLVQNWKTFVDR